MEIRVRVGLMSFRLRMYNVSGCRHATEAGKCLIFNLFNADNAVFANFDVQKAKSVVRSRSCVHYIRCKSTWRLCGCCPMWHNRPKSCAEIVAVCDLFVSLAANIDEDYEKKNFVIDCLADVFCHRLRTDQPAGAVERRT